MFELPGNEPAIYLHGDKFVKFWENFYATHQWEDGEKMNIYIDFPYCASTCKYCMFQTPIAGGRKKDIEIYEEKLLAEIDSMKHLFPLRQIGQIAFGGGTASMMSRETVLKIAETIGKPWDDALVRKMEVHPRDLNDDYITFLLDKAKITNMSIGIQSFNAHANKDQHRITCDLNDLIRHVGRLQEAGVSVNIDLVALFNGETERDWEIFYDDVHLYRELLNTDMFFTQVNYATEKRYYEHSLRLRKFLNEFIQKCPEYVFPEERYKILDIDDVQRYLDTTYFMIKPHYLKYLLENGLYKNDPRFGNYIGFGGNIEHKAFSLTSERQTIYTHYDFDTKRWIRQLIPTVVAKVAPGADATVPTINVGQYYIPPYDPEISGDWRDIINGK